MIHYHGTPISGTRQDAARFLIGRHALVSFFYPQELGAVMEYCQSFCLDNGAFSLWRSGGGDINVEAYAAWVRSIEGHPNCDWCLMPDKIDGDEFDNRRLVDEWVSQGLRCESVPVYHMHESLEWLDELLTRFKRVALGSSGQWASVGTSEWWARMAEIMQVACVNGVPRAKLHGLRMLDHTVFSRLPLSSADSTNAGVNAGSLKRFGNYVPPTASQRAEVIASRIEQHNSAATWCELPQTELILT